MTYEWTSDLETGHKVIDGQHKALFTLANNLAEAFQGGKGKDEIEKTLKFLIDYTEQHFHDEEALQIESNFPDLYRHRRDHLDFKKKVRHLFLRFQKEGPTEQLMNEIYTGVGDWLLHHIKSDDFVLAAFLRDPD